MKLVRDPFNLSFIPNRLVTNSEFLGKKDVIGTEDDPINTKKFTSDGIFSQELFGVFDVQEEYKCRCGDREGKFLEGSVCEKCNTEVAFNGSNIEKDGWIDISGDTYDEYGNVIPSGKDYKIISYNAYMMLEKIIGRVPLRNIIKIPNMITEFGDMDYEAIKAEQEAAPEQKYYYIGLVEFYRNYTEILDYYLSLTKDPTKHEDLYDYLSDRDNVFIDKIKVISMILRPAMRINGSLKLSPINTTYIRILKYNDILNSKIEQIDLMVNLMLENIQAEYFQLAIGMVDAIEGKTGHIRSQMNGVRLNFTARHIIAPSDADVHMDEVVVPYLYFLTAYQLELINVIKKVFRLKTSEANAKLRAALVKFDEEIYKLAMKIIKDEECSILLNRNPTISFGSILYLRITKIKDNIEDCTVDISNLILSPLAADYDGDGAKRFS